MEVDKNYLQKNFIKKNIVKVVYLLDELNKDKYTKHLLRYLLMKNIEI